MDAQTLIKNHHKWLHGILLGKIAELQDWDEYQYYKTKEARRRFKCEDEDVNHITETDEQMWHLQPDGLVIILDFGSEDLAFAKLKLFYRCGVDAIIWTGSRDTIEPTTMRMLSRLDKLFLSHDYLEQLRMKETKRHQSTKYHSSK